MFTKSLIKASLSVLTLLLFSWVVQTTYWEYSNSEFSKNVKVAFCNTPQKSKFIEFDIDARWTHDICYEVTNNWDEETNFIVDFVYWKLDWDGKWFSCAAWSQPKEWLSKYIQYDIWNAVSIQPKETKEFRAYLDLQNEIQWLNHACLTLKQTNREKLSWNLDVMMRTVYRVSANIIWWVFFDLENKWNFILPDWFTLVEKRWAVHILQDWDRRVYIETPFKNDWNQRIRIEQVVRVNWKNYRYSSNQNVDLAKGQERLIRFELPKFSTFEWNFKFEIKTTKTPIFQVGLEWITDEMKKSIVDELSFDIRFIPLMVYSELLVFTLIVIAVIIIVWSIIMRRRRAKQKYEVWAKETINSIAKKFWCKWSQIACLNNIKAPYNIKKWDKLYVYNFKKVK